MSLSMAIIADPLMNRCYEVQPAMNTPVLRLFADA